MASDRIGSEHVETRQNTSKQCTMRPILIVYAIFSSAGILMQSEGSVLTGHSINDAENK